MTDCVVRSRIDSHIKIEAMAVFEQMGLTLSEAIRLFLYQSVAQHSIPFSVNIPNAKTRTVIEEIEQGKGITKTSLQQLKQEWNK